jgi:ABC-type nitrate/sulfonate/bicarbonate transport system ATPase subunit
MGEKTPIVELKGVSKSFLGRNGKPVEVLKDFNFIIDTGGSIGDETGEHKKTSEGVPPSPLSVGERARCNQGRFVVLLGPSGCGKSTILSLISGWEVPDAGEISLFGNRIMGPNGWAATVPQSYTCFPWLTALGNVEFGLALKAEHEVSKAKKPGKSNSFLTRIGLTKEPEDLKGRRELAKQYLEKVGLKDRMDARPEELSGGMQQRVAIARTLAIRRPIVLMDEPFGALDAQTREDMQQMLLRLWEEEKNTIIFVTHDITEALLLGDRIIVISPLTKQIDKDMPWNRERPRKPGEFSDVAEQLRSRLKKMPSSPPQGVEHNKKDSLYNRSAMSIGSSTLSRK